MSRSNFSEQDIEAIQRRLMVRSGGVQDRGGVAGTNPASSPSHQSFTMYGQLCSGKNQVQLLWRNGKVCKYPNKTFTNWRARSHQDILNQWGVRPRIEVPVVLTCAYTPGDLRVRDITGQLDAIFHLLVYAGVLMDDGLVYESHWHRLPMSRNAPQIEIQISLWEQEAR